MRRLEAVAQDSRGIVWDFADFRSASGLHFVRGMPYTRHDDPETYDIIGTAMAVHSELGCGYLEAVYRAALKCEFRRRAIAFEHEVKLPIHYKGELLPFNYTVDFKCGPVLIEAKAADALAPAHLSQIINYLKASGLQRGLLINFGAKSLEYKRVIWTP